MAVIIGFLIAAIGVVLNISRVDKYLFGEANSVGDSKLKDYLQTTTVDEILEIDPKGEKKFIPRIDRRLVGVPDLKENHVIVFTGRMKSGKTREAGELIRSAIIEEAVSPKRLYDITGAIREYSVETLATILRNKLPHEARTLFYLEEIPLDVAPKYLEMLDEFIQAMNGCHPGYFVTSVRAEQLANNPVLQDWMKRNAQQIEIGPLNEGEKNQFIDVLRGVYPLRWDEAYRQDLLDLSDGTPGHLVLIFLRASEPKAEPLTRDAVRRIASLTLEENWKEIRAEIQKSQPLADALIRALAACKYANVTPLTELVFGLAESLERARPTRTTRKEIRSCVERAAKAFRYYGITYRDKFSFPDVAVEGLVESQEASEILEEYLRGEPAKDLNGPEVNVPRYKIDAFFELSVVYYYQGQKQKAIEALQWITKADPQRAAAWFNLGVLLKDLSLKRKRKKPTGKRWKSIRSMQKHGPTWVC